MAQEGNETVTNCYQLKMTAADGKQRQRFRKSAIRLDITKQPLLRKKEARWQMLHARTWSIFGNGGNVGSLRR